MNALRQTASFPQFAMIRREPFLRKVQPLIHEAIAGEHFYVRDLVKGHLGKQDFQSDLMRVVSHDNYFRVNGWVGSPK
jgi:hypothetical protein